MLRVASALLAVTFAGGCGRAHSLAAGTYAISPSGAPVSDGCGIAGRPGALWTLRFDSFGHAVKANYALFAGTADEIPDGIAVVGFFHEGSERFTADGSAPGPGGAGPVRVTAANGSACALEVLSVHLIADPESPQGPSSARAFAGELEIRFHAPAPDACVCTSRFPVRGELR